MKDYLNTKEKQCVIATLKTIEMLEKACDGNLFAKEEKTNVRKAVTFLGKAIFGKIDKQGNPIEGDQEGLLKRLNPSAAKTFNNSLKNTEMFVSDKYEINTYKTKVSAELDKAYEDNKDYFHLVELILDTQCKNCKCENKDCKFYSVFEEKCIPEFDGAKKFSNCRYAFQTDGRGNLI